MGMFNPKTNDGFYELGLAVVHRIAERIEREGVGRKAGEGPDNEKFSAGAVTVGGDSGEGWKEEKDSQGRTIWVET